MRFLPVAPHPHFRQQGHLGHTRRHGLTQPVQLVLGHLKDQFIVDLHDDATAPMRIVKHLLHLNHAQFDQVSRRPLHGRVDGRALGAGTTRPIG